MSYSYYGPTTTHTSGGGGTTTVSGISQVDANARYIQKGTEIDLGRTNRITNVPSPSGDGQPATRGYLSSEIANVKGQKGDRGPRGYRGDASAVAGPKGDKGDPGRALLFPGQKGTRVTPVGIPLFPDQKAIRGIPVGIPQFQGQEAQKGEKGDPGSSTLPTVDQNLSMQGYKIVQLGTPISNGDAATKAYVDGRLRGITKATADGLYLGLGGGSLQGAVHFVNASKITKLGNPQNAADAVNKRYVDYKVVSAGAITQHTVDNRYLSLNGGGLKGNLNMNSKRITNLAAPAASKHANNKKWVEDNFPKEHPGKRVPSPVWWNA